MFNQGSVLKIIFIMVFNNFFTPGLFKTGEKGEIKQSSINSPEAISNEGTLAAA